MKVWRGYGSEHSYKLVLIGHFSDEAKAAEVEHQIRKLQEAVPGLPEPSWESGVDRFPDELLDLLGELKVWDLTRAEIQGMIYDFGVERDGDILRISGDDAEIQGFIKLMIGRSARIEIYSAHDWTEEGKPKVVEPGND